MATADIVLDVVERKLDRARAELEEAATWAESLANWPMDPDQARRRIALMLATSRARLALKPTAEAEQ